MKRTILILIILVYSAFKTNAQIDSVQIANFLNEQNQAEERFINFIKQNKIDSCLNFFSSTIIDQYGLEELKKDLKKIHLYFIESSNVKNSVSIGKTTNGIGSFGHDNYGNYEKSSLYQFTQKEKLVYYFTLIFDDRAPIGIIRFFECKEISDSENEMNIEPLK